MKANFFHLTKLGAAGLIFLTPFLALATQDQDAYNTAKQSIKSEWRSKVLLMQGIGTESSIREWTIYFFDADVKDSHARRVVVKKGGVDTVERASSKKSADEALVFDPAMNPVPVESALAAARSYAKEKDISYDAVRVLLRKPSSAEAPVWRVEMLKGKKSRGAVYLGSQGAAVTRYSTPEVFKEEVEAESEGFFKDVENTFLDIGGELEEFFTGKRTIY
ncbi:MAG: hypothetical protein V1746_00025 [bacterium]